MIRNILAVCGLLGAIIASVALINAGGAAGGGEPTVEEETPKEELLATDSFGLESGLAVVEMAHQGEGEFAVDLLSTNQGRTTTSEPVEFSGDKTGGSGTQEGFALADKKGPANLSRAVKIPATGEHLFEVKADGPWTIKVEQPQPSSAMDTTSFSGDGDAATSLFRLSGGLKEVTVSNPTKEDLKISLLDKDGNEVSQVLATKPGEADQYPSDEVASTVDIPESGVYLFDVRAESLWAIDITDAG